MGSLHQVTTYESPAGPAHSSTCTQQSETWLLSMLGMLNDHHRLQLSVPCLGVLVDLVRVMENALHAMASDGKFDLIIYITSKENQTDPTPPTVIMNVEEEVERLKEEIKRLGKPQDDGSYLVTFGVLFNDDRCANIFEALVGTLRAAKRRKVLTYDGELLLQGVHDNVEIILKPTPEAASSDAVVKS
ncbi:Costars domain-containing protein [Forsythia ovata]|uniref:Costars domain-containing protein n=1 Tax=Forsythia ovata TaxID=205694 RepID=A0ABD1VIS5_9LAMI